MPISKRDHQKERSSLMARAALWFALLPVVVAPLLVGGVHPESHLLLGLSAMVGVMLLALDRARVARPLTTPVMALPLVVGAALTLVSLVPLPGRVLAALSPGAAWRVSAARALLTPDIAEFVRSTMAFDPPDTALALMRLLGGIAVVVVVSDRARHREGRTTVYRAIAATGLVMLVVAIGHKAIGMHRIWGSFGPGGGFLDAPLVNPNHNAKLWAALSLLCLARSLSMRDKKEALVLLVVGLALGAAVPLTWSRGGMVAFAVGVVVLFALLVGARTGDAHSGRDDSVDPDDAGLVRDDGPAAMAGGRRVAWRRRAAATLRPAGVLLFGLIAIANMLYLTGDAPLDELAHVDHSSWMRAKGFLWPIAWEVATHAPVLGVGNDGFGVAMTEFVEAGALRDLDTYTHVENLVFETLADHGLIGSALLALAVVVTAWQMRVLRSRAALAALPALCCLVVGDLADFVIELPAGTLLVAVCLGLLGGRRAMHGGDETAVEAGARALRRRRATLAAGLALVGVGLLGAAHVIAAPDWRPAIDVTLRGSGGAARSRLVDVAFARHPSDGYYALLRAQQARVTRDAALALRRANHAIVLWPGLPGPHVEAARALAAGGSLDQALLEYRAAWMARPDDAITREVAARTPVVAQRLRALPPTARAHRVVADGLIAEARLDEAQQELDDAADAADGTDDDAHAAVLLALRRGDADGAWHRMEQWLPGPPWDGDDGALGASVLEGVVGTAQALAITSTWLPALVSPRALLQWRLDAAVRTGAFPLALQTIELLRPWSREAGARSQLQRARATVLERVGNRAAALQVWVDVVGDRPRDADGWANRARLELELGLRGDARSSTEQLRMVAPGDARVVELEAKLHENSGVDAVR